MLAPGAGVEAVRLVVQRAIDRLAGHRPPVRLSCGIASTRQGARTPSELLRAADTALYAAKRTGRGRVVVAEPEPAGETRQTGRPGARRARRDGLEVDTGALITQGLGLLDGPLRAARAARAPRGARDLARRHPARRGRRGLAVHARRERDRDAVRARPPLRATRRASARAWTARATRSTSTRAPPSCWPAAARSHVYAGDDGADAAERALLGELGVTDVLLAAAADGRGAWLLEIYGDAASADLSARRRRAAAAVRPRGAAGERPARGAPQHAEPARRAVTGASTGARYARSFAP